MGFHAVDAAPVVVEGSNEAEHVSPLVWLDDNLRGAELYGDPAIEDLHHHTNQGHRVERQTGEIVDFDPVAPHQLVAFFRQLARQIDKTDLSGIYDQIAISLARLPLFQNGGRLVRFGEKKNICRQGVPLWLV